MRMRSRTVLPDPGRLDLPMSNNWNDRDKSVIKNPVVGTYTITISHKGSLQAANALEPGHPQFDPNEAQYELTTGQFQNFSLAIEGNQQLATGTFTLTLIEPVGGDLLLEWQSVPGVRYQVETATDLLVQNWTPFGGAIDAAGSLTPFTITGPLTADILFTRVLEVVP
jgi:hypothetical protein